MVKDTRGGLGGQVSAGARTKKNRQRLAEIRRGFRKRPYLYLMVVPGVLWFLVFCYGTYYGVLMAFQEFEWGLGILHSPWVGLKHFLDFFRSVYAARIIRNTFLLSFWSMVIGFPAPIVLALLFNELAGSIYKRFVQSVGYLPHFISMVVVVGMIFTFTSEEGPINAVLRALGAKTIYFFQDYQWFRPIYIVSGVWQGIGWGSIIYLAAMSGINPELYEAGRVDGMNRWQAVRYITLPGILPTISILLILRVSHILGVDFEKVYLLYNPAIYETSDVIATYVYRQGLVSLNYSYATAVGLFNSIVSLILLFAANYITKGISEYHLF